MAIQIKDTATLADKFANRAGAAAGDYQKGVQQPRRPWAASTLAAVQTWAQGVQQAVSSCSFQKGVNEAGDTTWSQNSATKGARRYPEGVQAGKQKWATKISPFLQVIAGLNLPQKGPRRSPQNIER